jgi:hypothetical protein
VPYSKCKGVCLSQPCLLKAPLSKEGLQDVLVIEFQLKVPRLISKTLWEHVSGISLSIVCTFFIENDAEILPLPYTWMVAFTNYIH